MGTGDYICVTLRGGAPWGFTLQEGEGDTYRPFLVSQVEEGGHASLAGVQEGDEVVSINGEPCADLTLLRAFALIDTSIDSLQLLVKRYHFVPSEDCGSKKMCCGERTSSGEALESTTLHIFSSKHRSNVSGELYTSESQGESRCGELDADTEVLRGPDLHLSDTFGGHELVFKKYNEEVRRSFSPGDMVELQVSLSEQNLDDGGCSSLVSARGIEGELSSRDVIETIHTTSITSHYLPCPAKEPLRQRGVVVRSPSSLGQQEGIPQQPAEASGAGRGVLRVGGPEVSDSDGEQCEGAPESFTISFQIPSEEAATGEEQDSDSDGDQEKPNKHRARHARLRRNESLSEKQVKEVKSKCKRIALLLSAAPPNPNNKGVLMFKKHRQRAKKFTLVSYGTGEDEPEFSDEEEEIHGDNIHKTLAGELTFEASANSKSDKPFFSHAPSSKGAITLNLDKSLLEIKRDLNNQAEMESLPDTKGKGALMFAQRRLRMDEISAEHDELRRQGIPVEGVQETEKKVAEHSYMQSATEGHAYMDVNMHQQGQQHYQQYQEQQYYEQQQNYQQQYQQYQQQQYEQREYQQQQMYQNQQEYHPEQQQMQHYSTNINGTVQHQTNEIHSSFSNRTAKPFTAENMVATPYSHAASGTNQDGGQGEQIASRDERISTPAIKTGLLDSRRKTVGKPMFTFKEAPKVSPSPVLLNLLNRSDKKGFESGPEEDYLSLGAEACNFLQSQRVKHKIPPPVAPKPMINPNSFPWSSQIEAANQDMPQCAENSLSTPAAAPTAEIVPALELEPTPAPAPESFTLPAAQETPAITNTAEQPAWTEPEAQQQPPQVTVQEANSQVNSALQSETSQMTWGAVQAQQQPSSCSWQSAQVQPQNPPPRQSSPQVSWATHQPNQNQTHLQHTTSTWTPQSQPSWTQPEEQAQGHVNPQPSWAQPQHPQSQAQVQPPWSHMKEKPHLPQMQPTWGQIQEPMQPQPPNSWTQPSQIDSQQQPPWVHEPQQKAQAQPPWVQRAQPETQSQPPWVQEQHHPDLPQSWPKAQASGQPQPPWVSGQPKQQPSFNAWAPSQTQVQSQPPWIHGAQVQPQVQPQVNLNPWAPVPTQAPSQPSWAQHPPEHGGQQHINTWAQEQNQPQHQPPWGQPVPSQPTPQPNWQQSTLNTSQQPQINMWPPGQVQPQAPGNDWRPQSQQTSLNVPTSTVNIEHVPKSTINIQPSPKPWLSPQNQTPPPPPQRMHSFTIGQKASSPINPMATVLNPKSTPGSAYEMPLVRGKGADMFAKRQSRMEKFVVDSETVEANKASRSTSPAASLPNEWKYTPNALGRSYSLSPLARVPVMGQKSACASSSPKPSSRSSITPPARQTSWLEKGFKPLTPWEAASCHPLGLVEEAFAFQNLQQSLASNVRLAAQRKMLPEVPAEWQAKVTYQTPQKTGSQTWSQSRSQSRAPIPSFVSPTRSPVSTPASHVGYRSLPRQWRPQKYMAEANQRPLASLSQSNRPSERQTYKSVYTSSTWSWRR
ncbi:synaptopodin-2 isoform X2 [Kryptolebias marmoratus]|uniref:synaptopodin-2 isoform X2 n=1 Tax=Kryptolebias marmoratus TaxID=37003 RepID=UPI0018ACB716|nr:synaptopodin-2 isoform X2 [Kryptolebias marmoratus]